MKRIQADGRLEQTCAPSEPQHACFSAARVVKSERPEDAASSLPASGHVHDTAR